MVVTLVPRTRATPWLAFMCVALMVGVVALPSKYAILAILALAGGLLVIARPWWGIAVLAVLLPANNLISQLLGATSLSTAFGAIKDAVLAILLVAAVASGNVRREFAWPALAVAALGLMGFAYSGSLSSALYGWRNDYEPVLLVIAVPALLTATTARYIRTIVVVAAQVAALVGIYTWTLGLSWLVTLHIFPGAPGAFPFQYFSTNNVHPRAFSPLASPNEFGAYLDLALAVIVTRTDWSVRRRAALCVLPVIAIYLSRSRSGILGVVLLASLLAVMFVRRYGSSTRLGLSIVIGLGFIAVLVSYVNSGGVASTGTDPSLVGHASSLREGIGNALTHPLGYGLGNVGPRAIRSNTNPVLVESFWLLQALESGLLVLVAYLFTVGRIVRVSARAGGEAFLAVAAIAATLISQLVLPTMQDGPVSFTFWMVMGLALVGLPDRRATTNQLRASKASLRVFP
jgi:putative inorganic carbon (HCO3(-)) transporter